MEHVEASPGHKSLEEQFAEKEIVRVRDEELGILDIVPEHLKTETPTFFVPGWGMTPEAYRENILELAGKDRRVLSFESPHGIDAGTLKEMQDAASMPEAELRKVSALVTALIAKNLSEVNVVAHSEGGLYTILAATLFPEKFKRIVLVNPGGMIGEDSPRQLVKRTAEETLAEASATISDKEKREHAATILRIGTESAARNPAQSLREMRAIAGTQIHELLRGLKERGVRISIIHSVDDKIFPMERVQEIAREDQLDGFYSVKGTHNIFALEPREYTELVDQALSALETKDKTPAQKAA